MPTGWYVHESAYVDEIDQARIGPGTRIWHFCHVMRGAVIGKDCQLGQSCFVDRDAVIGDGCKLQNHVSIYASVTLEDDVFCGPAATFTNVTEPAAGTYTMAISFMSVGQPRTATVTVNGVAQTVSFPQTPDYNTVVTKNITVPLKAGNNTITFSNPTAGAPNRDRIVV